MPKISVVMAAFNSEKTILEAIDSIIAQSEPDWELIVVDDCSSDRTAEIVEQFLHDDRITLLKNNRNLGSGHSRNLAIQRAKAPWIGVQDADDISLPNRLEHQLSAVHDNPTASVISCQVAEFGDWGGPVVGSWPTDSVKIERRYVDGKMPVAHCGALMRLNTINEAGGYDTDCRRAQDYALFRRMLHPTFVTIPEVGVLYRTERPLPLRYAIMSGRYGRLAKIKTRRTNPKMDAVYHSLPLSIFTDLRSIVTWLRRRLNERPKVR